MTTETQSPESVNPGDTAPASVPWSSYLHLENLRRTLICACVGLAACWVASFGFVALRESQLLQWDWFRQTATGLVGLVFSALVVAPITRWSGDRWQRVLATSICIAPVAVLQCQIFDANPEGPEWLNAWLFPDPRREAPIVFWQGSLFTVLTAIPLISWSTRPRLVASGLWPVLGVIASYVFARWFAHRSPPHIPYVNELSMMVLTGVAVFSVWAVPLAAALSVRLWEPRAETAVANES